MAIIHGTPGNDKNTQKLAGTEQADEIYGYEGHDYLVGGLGNDTLVGGAGNDILVGGGGDDILTGSQGRDRFNLYYSGGGTDIITDFVIGEDLISISSAPSSPIRGKTGLEPPEVYLSYNPTNGGLYYRDSQPILGQEIAILPSGLDANQVINSIVP